MRKIDTSLIVRLCLPQFAVGLFTTMLNNYLIYFISRPKNRESPISSRKGGSCWGFSRLSG